MDILKTAPDTTVEINSNKQDNLKIEQIKLRISEIKLERLALDEKIKGEENKLKSATVEDKKVLEGIISGLYAEDDAFVAKIKSLMELIKKEEVENERAVDPYKNSNIDAIDVRVNRSNNSDK